MRPIRLCFAVSMFALAALAAKPAHALVCSPFQSAGTADVWLSDGSCRRISPGSGRVNLDNAALSTGRFVAHVRTGSGVGVWVCPAQRPTGWDYPTMTPDSPCWSLNDTGYVYRRIRGDKAGTYPYAYVGAENSNVLMPDGVTRGYSIVVQGGSGNLTGDPTCPAIDAISGQGIAAVIAAFNWTFVGRTSDSGLPEWLAVPVTGGNNVSGPWPTGGFGRPCLGYGGDGNYATITYQSDANLY